MARKPPAQSSAGPTVTRQEAPPPTTLPPPGSPNTQIAAVPPSASVAPPRSPPLAISADYRIALSTWLERHKIYPETARQRGEQGSAILRFRVGRDGRVLAYHLVQSTVMRHSMPPSTR